MLFTSEQISFGTVVTSDDIYYGERLLLKICNICKLSSLLTEMNLKLHAIVLK